MRGFGWLVTLALGCGPAVGTIDGGGEGGGSSAGEDGPGQSGSGGGDAADTSGGNGSDTSGDVASTTGEPDPCLLAIRLDLCCNQPVPATPGEVEADDCLVPWPLGEVPDDVWATCLPQQPEGCGIVDCDYAPPPTEDIALTDAGPCMFMCPEGESVWYAEPGCDFPPSIGACLNPPPPCAMDYCSCEGETISGCGLVAEPFQSEGACE